MKKIEDNGVLDWRSGSLCDDAILSWNYGFLKNMYLKQLRHKKAFHMKITKDKDAAAFYIDRFLVVSGKLHLSLTQII